MNQNGQTGVQTPATQAPRAITPEVLPPAKTGTNSTEEDAPAKGWQRIAWIILSILCIGWIFIPNFFFVPIPFFIDEGIAAFLLVTALSKLGIRIPFLSSFFQKRFGGPLASKK